MAPPKARMRCRECMRWIDCQKSDKKVPSHRLLADPGVTCPGSNQAPLETRGMGK